MLTDERRAEIRETMASLWGMGMDATAEIIDDVLAENERLAGQVTTLRINLADAERQLVHFWDQTHSCPCGARKKSPRTHPHVPTCPTAAALDATKE